MGMNTFKLVFFALLLSVGLLSCEPEEGVVPCEPTPASAAFKVYEVLERPTFNGNLLVEVDTAAVGTPVSFRSQIANQLSYSWFIGLDPRNFTTPSVGLTFPILSSPINVSLTTRNRDQCTGQTTRDSLVRSNVLIVRDWDRFNIDGYYQGSLASAPNDTFTIGLVSRSPCPTNPSCSPTFFIDNYPRGYEGYDILQADSDPIYGYKKVSVWRRNQLLANPSTKIFMRGLIRFTAANTRISAEFETSQTQEFTSFTLQTFTGKRL
jgi:hypothetical protein